MDDISQLICLPGCETFEQKESLAGTTHPEWFFEWAVGGGRQVDAGVRVNGYTALSHCPLWQGVNIIAGDIGQTPVRLVRNEFNDQKRHPAWKVLRLRPNRLQTPSVWKETMMQWALIWGNGVSLIVRDRGMRPVELIPLRPDFLTPHLVDFEEEQILVYRYNSLYTGKHFVFAPEDVIHIQGLTSDGIWGYPLHEIARNCIGHGLSLEKHGNKSFANAARPSGVLEHPTRLRTEARENLRREWERIHAGADNAGRIAILQEGMKFQALSMTNIDAQWIEAKKLDRVNAASLLNLPAHKLNALEDSSVRANIEEQNADYVQRTLSRWYNRLAEEYKRKLLTDREWMSDEFEFLHDFESFLRSDVDTLSQVVDRLIKAEVMNRNEGRRKFGLPPYDGGDQFGSPAINPRPQDGEEPPEPDEDNGEASTTNHAHTQLLLDRTTHLLECEASRLKWAASNCKNFVEWLDDFYGGNGKPAKFSSITADIVGASVNAAVSVGLPAQNMAGVITAWGLERRRDLLEACSHVTSTELPSTIDTFLTPPEETASQLVAAVLEDTSNGTQDD